MNTHAALLTIKSLLQSFIASRQYSLDLCKNLEVEDMGLQAVAETSPLKWHLAHTSWFYETFVLKYFVKNFKVFHPAFETLFNSYYNGIGKPFKRPNRGLLSRPTVEDVKHYRKHVDDAVIQLLNELEYMAENQTKTLIERVSLGIQHEKQHQELMLTDLKYNFYQNPLLPTYSEQAPNFSQDSISKDHLDWHKFNEGLHSFGFSQGSFCFDNEMPSHKIYLPEFAIANRCITNSEYLDFINDGGYQKSEYWLSDGWAWVEQNNISKPLYWWQQDGEWLEYTLYGKQRLTPNRTLCHISFYEADAFARWAGNRLPNEYEWELLAQSQSIETSKERALYYHPTCEETGDLFNQVWQWTQSNYAPYPGFKPASGAIGEYNGKFMCNQMVLRGGSCLSPSDHIRSTYRNFFYPADRWQMTGIRLAQDRG
ncbi:MAG: ergothioneine biosynthesis protein EgtB [Gammaproteobacteria bacterium]|nr:ergothioneine biosynthesis protein EgtB [Gammaproteobacteria bacterium]